MTLPSWQSTVKSMTTLRPLLHLALALSLVSLTCGIGAVCAEMGESCCCMTDDGGSPCTEMSGGRDAPIDPEPAASIESSERFSVAIVDAAPLVARQGATAQTMEGRILGAARAAPTPLYLSHCAFLC